jgi:uncharacterized repeat protein (TIGR01451 family)
MTSICRHFSMAIPVFLLASLFAVKQAWGAIDIDANVSTNQATASTSIQTGSFSTTAGNELLLAFIATDGVSTPNITVTNLTTTGLSWTLVRRTSVQLGTSEIWRAFSTVPLSNITVRAALSQSVLSSMTVMSFMGVDTTGVNGAGAIGMTGTGNGNPGLPTASLVAARGGSLVLGVGNDWDSAVSHTPGAGQSLVNQYLAPVGDTYWVQRQNSPTPAAGTTVTIYDTAPATDRYNLTIVEVLPVAVVTTAPDLSITKSHAGTFVQGQTGANYAITVTNSGGATTSGTVTVNDTLPASLTATAISGTGWNCATAPTLSCTRSDTLAAGASYPVISLTMNVASNAPASVTNTATVSGGGETNTSNDTANDVTTINTPPDPTITKSHAGSFSQGQIGATYSITVTNSGGTATAGTVTVTDTLPASLTAAAIAGTGWTCTISPTLACTRSDALNVGASYPAITVTVNVASNAPASVTNTATVSGGGETNTSNDSASDNTVINPAGGVGTIVLDVNVSKDQAPASASVMTPAFSTTSGSELLLAFVASDYQSSQSSTNISVTTVSGAGLSWVLVKRSNTQAGTAEVWRAFAPSILSNVTVIATLSQSVQSSMTVLSFAGVDTSGTNGSGAIGATFSTNAPSGAPTASLLTTRNNSWVFGVGNDYDNAIARTPGSGQRFVHQDLAPVNDTYWVQMQNTATPLSGTSVTINDTAPTTDRYNLALVELLPSLGGGGGTSTFGISGTISPAANGASTTVSLSGSASASATSDAGGNYAFSGLANGSYVIAPSKSSFTFTPSGQNVTVSGANITSINFTAQAVASSGIKLVQAKTNGNESGTASMSVAFTANNTAGNFLIVTGTAARPARNISVSDSLGNIYSVAMGPLTDTTQDVTLYIWYVSVCKGGANTVTIAPAGTSALEIHVSEWSGLATTNPVDVTAFATGTGAAVSSGSKTTTSNGDLVFGYGWVLNTATAGTGFTPLSLINGDLDEYQIQTTGGSVAATFTQTSGTWFAAIATFKGNSSSSPPADTTPPSAPANFAAAVTSSTQINLTWTASTDNVGVTGYKVERCQGAACSNFAEIATPTATMFNDTGLTASTSYSYRVRATDAANNLSSFSNTTTTSTQAAAPVSVTISPKRAGITTGQTLTFSASVTGSANTAVSWEVDTLPGGNSNVGTMDATGKYTPPPTGAAHTVTARSQADTTKTASANLGVTDLPGVFTYHNNLSRDGTNVQEYALTAANVNTSTFGKLFSCAVDGAVYAQPLWAGNLTIGSAKHNVIYVATQHESLYAFDADSNASPCVPLWHANLIDAAHGGTAGETSVPSGHIGGLVGNGYGDIEAEVGITGTPVIDPSTNTLYVVSKSVNASTQFFQRLHALDLATGNEKLNSNEPVLISASVPGNGDGSSGGTVAFDTRNQHQRPGLALVNGVIYVAWASHEDHDPYHGWVIGYNASTVAQVPGAVFNTTPNHVGTVSYSRGGIWMGGGAPAADASYNLYFITGNGTYDGLNNFGDSILRLSTSSGLSAMDWFTPNDQAMLDQNDTDLGSGASTILVDLPSAPVHQLLIGGGKEGTLYLLDRTKLGHFTPTNSGVVQSFPASNGIFATPAFWQNNLYYAADGDTLKMFTLDPVLGLFTPIAGPSATSHSSNSFGFPGSTPSVSASGVANGIVWALDNSQYGFPAGTNGPAVLHAYDATNLTGELWNSNQETGNGAGNAVKFTVPTVANGKVYIGTRTELDVYGLKPN